MDRDLGLRSVGLDGDLAVFQRQRMAERNEFAGFLGAHHAGQNGSLKNGAFLRRDLTVVQ